MILSACELQYCIDFLSSIALCIMFCYLLHHQYDIVKDYCQAKNASIRFVLLEKRKDNDE